MRVGRVSAVNFVSYKDVRALYRYSSIKRVALGLGNGKLSKINTLVPYDKADIKQQAKVSKAINNVMIDTMETRAINNSKDVDQRINAIKLYKQAQNGSDINVLKQLVNSQVDLPMLKNNNSINNTDFKQENLYANDDKLSGNTFNKTMDELAKDYKKLENKDDKLSIIEKYAKQLEDVLKEKDKEKLDKDKKDKQDIEKEKSDEVNKGNTNITGS